MTARVPLTYCSFAIEGAARVLILEGAFEPLPAAYRAKELGFWEELRREFGTDTYPYQMLAFVVPDDLEEWEYQAYLANLHRLLTLEEARELFEAKSISEHFDTDQRFS